MFNIETYGSLLWEVLHGWAFTYPENPPQSTRDRFMLMLQNFQVGCPICQQHYDLYIQTNPPNLNSQYHFSRWMVDFHNDVNRRLKRPEMTWEEARQRFLFKSTQTKKIHLVYESKRGELVDGRTMMPMTSVQLSQVTDNIKNIENRKDGNIKQNKQNPVPDDSTQDESEGWTVIILIVLIVVALPILMFGLSKWYQSI